MPRWQLHGKSRKGGLIATIGSGANVAFTNWDARVFAATGSHLAGSDITNYNNLFVTLTSKGFFNPATGASTLLDLLRIDAAPNATIALLNLAPPNLVSDNSPFSLSHTAYAGFNGFQNNNYIDTTFNPTTGSPNYAQDSAHISAWINSATTSRHWIGMDGPGDTLPYTLLGPNYEGTNADYFYINSSSFAGSVSDASLGGLGFYCVTRDGVGVKAYHYNSGSAPTDMGANTQASSAVVNATFYTYMQSPAGFSGSVGQASAFSIGAALTSQQFRDLGDAIGTYRTAVGL